MSSVGTARPAARDAQNSLIPSTATGFRPDIQGLRALAVVAVVVYHLYPNVLPGGYVGVDVFFVISGFLITGHLASRFARTGRVRMLEFYGRRARRLLPAAVLVLMVTWLAGQALLPTTRLPAAATEIRAAALYIENWVLARHAVDYLAEQEAPSPVQHYWSLSVEEQFYLIWPLLFLAAAGVVLVLARRGRDRRARRAGLRVAAGLAGAIVALSLAYSVYDTATDRAAAYFVTPTRLWELGVGGVLALTYPTVARAIGRVGLLAWLGLGLVVGSAVLLTGASAFPGWIALLPTLGTALLIAAGSTGARHGPAWLFTWRPAVFLGDVSYSIYLWHWPLIVLWLAYSGGAIGVFDGPLIAVLAVGLAWLTKIAVEDPFRRARWVAPYPGRSLATATAAVLPVALTTVFLLQQPGPGTSQADGAHPGARALAGDAAAAGARSGSTSPSSSPQSPGTPRDAGTAPEGLAGLPIRRPPPSSLRYAVPPINEAPGDLPFGNQHGCKAELDDTRVVTCTRGDIADPARTVALVGDSFAAEWSSALAQIADQEHWKLVLVTHDGCPFTSAMILRSGEPYLACQEWGRNALRYLLDDLRPDVVITSFHPGPAVPEHPDYGRASEQVIAHGMIDYWRQLAAADIYVIGIKPTPDPHRNVPDCLSGRGGSIQACTVPRSTAVYPLTAIGLAVRALGPAKASEINLDNYLCDATDCPPVVGNVVVYRDEKHVTRTYSLTLAPYLKQGLLAVPALRT